MGNAEGKLQHMDAAKQETPSRDDQERALFDEIFAIDQQRDAEDVKNLMRRVRRIKNIGSIGSSSSYEGDKQRGLLKYTDEQIEAGQWEEDDLKLVIEGLRKEKIEKYFGDVAEKYEQRLPVTDSVVRLEEEANIAESLRRHTPVLIRGHWRMGKTSMAKSLATHQFGEEHSFFMDTAAESVRESLEDFAKFFGASDIARFIVGREWPSAQLNEQFEKEDEVVAQIEAGSRTAFEFLNDYLAQKDEQLFVALDEVVGFARQPDRLQFIANLKGLSQIHLAIVLHRVAAFEQTFADLFEGYETHFVKPLTVEEVRTLIRKPLEGTRITFTDEAVQKIIEFTGGRPMEINNLCSALMDPFSELKQYRFTYRAENIDALTQKDSWDLGESFRVAIDTYRQVYDRAMNEEERAIVDRLVEAEEVPLLNIDSATIQPLVDTTIVAIDEHTGVYRINGTLFKRVIAEQKR